MNIIEKDLEDILFECMSSEEGQKALAERGLTTKGLVFRQVDLGAYGRIDLLTVEFVKNSEGYLLTFTIYELKKDEVNVNTLVQGSRYVSGLRRIVYKEIQDDKRFIDVNINLRMIGNSVRMDDFVLLYNNIKNSVEIYTYNFSVKGFVFELVPRGWYKENEGFNNPLVEKIKHPGVSLLRKLLNSSLVCAD